MMMCRWYTVGDTKGVQWSAGAAPGANPTGDLSAGFDKELPSEWESWLR